MSTELSYRVSRKMLGTAIAIEAAIIASSLFASYAFATKYAGDTTAETQVASLGWLGTFVHHGLDWQLAMTGGIAVAVAELARLPLAVASRVHASTTMRVVALLAVLLCCGLTVKRMSNVLQQAYAPRLHLVQETTRAVKEAEADLATIAAKRGSADAALAPLQSRVDEANQRIEELNARIAEQGKAPAQKCWDVPHRSKKTGKRWTTTAVLDTEMGGAAICRSAVRGRCRARRCNCRP